VRVGLLREALASTPDAPEGVGGVAETLRHVVLAQQVDVGGRTDSGTDADDVAGRVRHGKAVDPPS